MTTKNNNKNTILYILIVAIILIFGMKGCKTLTPQSAAGNSSGAGSGIGGSGGGGGSSDVVDITPTNTCAQTASDNGFAHYNSPIRDRMACSVYSFSDCTNRGLEFSRGAYSSGLQCCMWDCKQTADTDDGASEPLCSDSDGGYNIWKYGVVNVPRLTVMYPDRCIDGRYLQEWHCDANNVAVVDTVDCFMNGAICNAGACVTPSCEQIINPQSQSDCDRGHSTCYTAPETYCLFKSSVASPNRCMCARQPNSCENICYNAGYYSGRCSYIVSKNPCGTDAHVSSGDQFCANGPLMGIGSCCCNR